nr:VOC family protein [uncultured Psychroserpens sp.]
MRIDEIVLFSADLKSQKYFYKDVLGCNQLKDDDDHISFQIGESVLSFQYREQMKPSHLAINIPSQMVHQALDWLEERIEVIPSGDDKITDFENWKAKAVYFYDADKNIMEFIARERIEGYSTDSFSEENMLSISEMALAVLDIESVYKTINAIKSIPIFDGNFDRFCALGNDDGLFIIIDKTKKKWYPTNDEAFTSEFVIKGDYNFKFENGKIIPLLS